LACYYFYHKSKYQKNISIYNSFSHKNTNCTFHTRVQFCKSYIIVYIKRDIAIILLQEYKGYGLFIESESKYKNCIVSRGTGTILLDYIIACIINQKLFRILFTQLFRRKKIHQQIEQSI